MKEVQLELLREKLMLELLLNWLPAQPERKQPAPSAGTVQEKVA
jgi:hypothetical protein